MSLCKSLSQNIIKQNFFKWHAIGHSKQSQRSMARSAKQSYTSAVRNSQPISEAFLAQIDKTTPNLKLLEISSGSGQHAGYLAPLCPNITIQPTEYERGLFSSISAYAADCPTKNILQPLFVDIAQEYKHWPDCDKLQPGSFDYMFNSNMMHITPWECSIGLFRAAGQLLKPNGYMFTYGPYALDGVLTPESNVNFDISLKQRNATWGIRDIADLKELATRNGLILRKIQEMPSNNKFLTWQKLA